jgi:isopenicillin-N N-acyltransferase like protein
VVSSSQVQSKYLFRMLEVNCSGSPQEVGIQHGSAAKPEINRCITFYQNLFQLKCRMDWEEVKRFALQYQPYLSQNWPQYISEMEGVAAGSGVKYEDILALNVRTEIAFGAFNDGCTAISWKGKESSFLAQNWDWNTEFVSPLSPNTQTNKPNPDNLKTSSISRSRCQMDYKSK